MLFYLARRLLWAVFLIFVISLITFIIFFVLPADSRSAQRNERGFTPELQTQYEIRGSLPEEYLHFVRHIVLLDLGESTRANASVTEVLRETLPVTLSLVIGGMILCLVIAFPIGILSALRPRSLLDKGLMFFVLIGVAAHPVWLGLMLSYFLGVRLHWFPVGGYCDFVYDPESSNLCGGPRYWAYHMVLPWITFAFLFAALYARMIRANMLEAMEEDYVRTARAKGAGTARVMHRHVLRNAMLPVVSMLGMDISVAFGGALFIETVYELPGMGRLLVRSLANGDLPVILGVVVVVSLAVAIVNLVTDFLYSVIDPRVRVHGKAEPTAITASLRRRPQAQPRVKESPTQV